VQGEWRQEPFGKRHYEKLSNYVPANVYTTHEADTFLHTHLDGFLGTSYIYIHPSIYL
jgi:hypothetical protein